MQRHPNGQNLDIIRVGFNLDLGNLRDKHRQLVAQREEVLRKVRFYRSLAEANDHPDPVIFDDIIAWNDLANALTTAIDGLTRAILTAERMRLHLEEHPYPKGRSE